MSEVPANQTALKRRVIELLTRVADHSEKAVSPDKKGYYTVVSACSHDVAEAADSLRQLRCPVQAERLLRDFRPVKEHWEGGVYRAAPGAS
jgi:hypothetical protein